MRSTFSLTRHADRALLLAVTFYDQVKQQIALVRGGDKRHPVKPTFAQELKTDLAKALLGFFRALCLLADQKEQDYGSINLTTFGLEGIVIRMFDKACRLRNLVKRPPVLKSETILDTIADGIDYEAIGFLMAAGLWPDNGLFATRRHVDEMEQSLGPEVNSPNGPSGADPIFVGSRWITCEKCRTEYNTSDIHDCAADKKLPPQMIPDALIARTLEECQPTLRPDDLQRLPSIGAIYKHKRVPALIRVLAVIPSYHTMSTQIFIVSVDVVQPQHGKTGPDHMRVEPLEWFCERYTQSEHIHLTGEA